jgi:hypothetical protein
MPDHEGHTITAGEVLAVLTKMELPSRSRGILVTIASVRNPRFAAVARATFSREA